MRVISAHFLITNTQQNLQEHIITEYRKKEPMLVGGWTRAFRCEWLRCAKLQQLTKTMQWKNNCWRDRDSLAQNLTVHTEIWESHLW